VSAIAFKPFELILHASKIAHLSQATLLPALHVTGPHLRYAKLTAEYDVLASAMIISPQLIAWFGVSHGVLLDVPLFVSWPVGDR
jgi:hypothetical protein